MFRLLLWPLIGYGAYVVIAGYYKVSERNKIALIVGGGFSFYLMAFVVIYQKLLKRS
jgi:hypothetical protein